MRLCGGDVYGGSNGGGRRVVVYQSRFVNPASEASPEPDDLGLRSNSNINSPSRESRKSVAARRNPITTLVVVVGFVFVEGCAFGYVTDHTMHGFALGHAKLERCEEVPSVCPVALPPAKLPKPPCVKIEGGALANNFGEMIAALAAIFTAAFVAP